MGSPRLLVREYEGKFVKENEEEILIEVDDGVGIWYAKALIEGVTRNPLTDLVHFRATKLAAVRRARL